MTRKLKFALLSISIILSLPSMAQSNPLVGSWRLIAADKLLPDGRQLPDYGSAPTGIAIFTDDDYTVEVFRTDSSSCYFGAYSVDISKSTITLNIERASFPNYDRTSRVSPFTLKGDTLTWRTPPRPDGTISVSVFTRIHQPIPGELHYL